MIAVAERLPVIVLGGSRHPPAGGTAHDLALGFLRYCSAYWRGDPGASVFATRLGTYWRGDVPPPPDRPPDALSPHGGGGRGIGWYQLGDEVLGCVPGGCGGYLVPTAAIPRLVRCAPPYPRATAPPAQPERERDHIGLDHEAIDQGLGVVSALAGGGS